MVVAIKDAIEVVAPGLPTAVKKSGKSIDSEIRKVIAAVSPKPWVASDDDVVVAYHIARLIRNAYSHGPFSPTWMVHDALRNKVFAIPDVLTLDTTGLHGLPFDWRHYGGPLAMFRFCRFVRLRVLGDEPTPRKVVPIPKRSIYQQGDMILRKIERIPEGAERIDSAVRPDGGVSLGGGHVLYPGRKVQEDQR